MREISAAALAGGLMAAIMAYAQEPRIAVSGNVYYKDGATPIRGKGGVDWKVQARDALGNELQVNYDGFSYRVKVDVDKLPEDKQIQLTVWAKDQADRVIEGINGLGRTTLDVILSAEP